MYGVRLQLPDTDVRREMLYKLIGKAAVFGTIVGVSAFSGGMFVLKEISAGRMTIGSNGEKNSFHWRRAGSD